MSVASNERTATAHGPGRKRTNATHFSYLVDKIYQVSSLSCTERTERKSTTFTLAHQERRKRVARTLGAQRPCHARGPAVAGPRHKPSTDPPQRHSWSAPAGEPPAVVAAQQVERRPGVHGDGAQPLPCLELRERVVPA